ncbi:MAG: ribosomal RNA small subunit methyltransferase A [Candidatus Thorarchaeota archaeon]|nr:ribosomal RNA small subunit methyltransferase A [Candidatus Thorarchaeota archaeon]
MCPKRNPLLSAIKTCLGVPENRFLWDSRWAIFSYCSVEPVEVKSSRLVYGMSAPKKNPPINIKSILGRYGIVPNHQFGQNFIIDKKLIAHEVALAGVRKSDIVLEIGPGIGILTEALAKKAGRVVAIEKDRQFEGILTALQKQSRNLEVVWGDALNVELPKFTKVVSNLPFRVALPLMFKIMDSEFDTAVLVCQERLARRITAKPGEKGYSRIGVQVARRTNPRLLYTVSREKFFPPPEVGAALLRLEGIPAKFEVPSEAFFREVLKYLFSFRERTAGKALNTLKAFSIPTQRMMKARRLVGEGILRKNINAILPSEFGRITRVLWDEFGDITRKFHTYYDKMNLYKQDTEEI